LMTIRPPPLRANRPFKWPGTRSGRTGGPPSADSATC
jgi:hypothetical protein